MKGGVWDSETGAEAPEEEQNAMAHAAQRVRRTRSNSSAVKGHRIVTLRTREEEEETLPIPDPRSATLLEVREKYDHQYKLPFHFQTQQRRHPSMELQ